MYAESDVPQARVALVLGAQVKPDGTPSAFLAARLDLAKRLYDAGIVPPNEFSLAAGDVVSIDIAGIGTLTNPVVQG